MSHINSLPNAVVQELEKAGIPRDSAIFFQKDRWVYQVQPAVSTGDRFENHPIDPLGPYGIHLVDISFELNPERSEYTILKIRNRELGDTERITGIFAPIAEITLQGNARETANIPDEATHFCWLYPGKNTANNDDMNLENTHEQNLLKIGGFAYFAPDKNNPGALRSARIYSLIISASNGLTFEEPLPWKKEFTKQLRNQKRFQPVTLPSVRNKGAQYFAFINPSESFFNNTHSKLWIPPLHGAFAYLFNEDYSPHQFDCYFPVADYCLGESPCDEQ